VDGVFCRKLELAQKSALLIHPQVKVVFFDVCNQFFCELFFIDGVELSTDFFQRAKQYWFGVEFGFDENDGVAVVPYAVGFGKDGFLR